MERQWAVVIVSATPQGERWIRDMVGVAEAEEVLPEGRVTLCADMDEAQRIAGQVSAELSLPTYDGADPYPTYVRADLYVDTKADGPDPYANLRTVSAN